MRFKMRITDALLGEHGLFCLLFESIAMTADTAKTAEEIHIAVKLFAAAVTPHAEIEEELLFPAFEAAGGPVEPLAVMRTEHEEIEHLITSVANAKTADSARDCVLALLAVLRSHFAKEEEVLFPMCETTIGDAKLVELGQRWAQLRGVQLG